MIHIKRFIDKISHTEGRQGRDIVLPLAEARSLRDELIKMLADNYELSTSKTPAAEQEVIQIEIVGGKF